MNNYLKYFVTLKKQTEQGFINMFALKVFFLIVLIGSFSCSDKSSKTNIHETSSTQKASKGRQAVVVAISDSSQKPLVFEDGSGVSNDIVSELNRMQGKYIFTHELVPNQRMKKLGTSGTVNMVAFSNLNFGWDNSKIKASAVLVQDKDIYFTLKETGKDNSYFNNFKSLSIAGVKGFHYHFNREGVTFIGAQNEKAVLDLVLLKRANIGVVSSINLQYLSLKNPEIYSGLLISDKYDSEYSRSFLIMENSSISVEEVNALLEKMKLAGTLKNIFEKYGMKNPAITEN